MIEEILSMKRRAVNRIMVPIDEVVAFAYNQTVNEVIESYKIQHYSRYPVYFKNMDQIVGLLFIKDIITFWHKAKDKPVVEFVRFPHFVYEDRPALDTFLELQKLRLSVGVVMDEFGGISGIITLEDLIEEIVGEIEDELDERQKPFVEKISEQEYIVNTRMEIDDFSEYFNISIDEDSDVTTVSGLILINADCIPKVGEVVTYKNLKFKILEGTKRKISKVKVILK
ncbi:MAG: transporter associated domain-containing protein [bacterium]